ncbi:MAG TPA: 23S rRNA (guanosine(2251)-2'-O)-methyltransferase RlmB [Dissulfurispiraceae bacterium]|nr:23S rRNA (guanosine(2251)-2'-O)-methyltransferase RlmB [Dissulfurispiraceae bacterium]
MRHRGRSGSPDPGKPRTRTSANEELYICGVNPVTEALKSGTAVRALFVDGQSSKHLHHVIDTAKSRNIPIKSVGRDFFEGRFEKGHQGIAASVSPKKVMDINDLIDLAFSKSDSPFFLVLDCIEDPRNFGAILRVADAAGVDGVIFQSRRSAGLTPVVYKTSAGAVEHVNLSEVVNIKHALTKLKDRNIVIIGAEAGSPDSLWEADLRVPLALIVGSEGEGMRRTVRDMCDMVVQLPMKGVVNSLNVSVATGAISYEIMRQRNG